MALPQTAAQIQMMLEAWNQRRDVVVDRMREWHASLIALMIKRVFLQRPHSDDMIQMLDDLGIDFPEKQPISYDGLTIRLR